MNTVSIIISYKFDGSNNFLCVTLSQHSEGSNYYRIFANREKYIKNNHSTEFIKENLSDEINDYYSCYKLLKLYYKEKLSDEILNLFLSNKILRPYFMDGNEISDKDISFLLHRCTIVLGKLLFPDNIIEMLLDNLNINFILDDISYKNLFINYLIYKKQLRLIIELFFYRNVCEFDDSRYSFYKNNNEYWKNSINSISFLKPRCSFLKKFSNADSIEKFPTGDENNYILNIVTHGGYHDGKYFISNHEKANNRNIILLNKLVPIFSTYKIVILFCCDSYNISIHLRKIIKKKIPFIYFEHAFNIPSIAHDITDEINNNESLNAVKKYLFRKYSLILPFNNYYSFNYLQAISKADLILKLRKSLKCSLNPITNRYF